MLLVPLLLLNIVGCYHKDHQQAEANQGQTAMRITEKNRTAFVRLNQLNQEQCEAFRQRALKENCISWDELKRLQEWQGFPICLDGELYTWSLCEEYVTKEETCGLCQK